MKEGYLIVFIDQFNIKQRIIVEGCYIKAKRKIRKYFPRCYIQKIEPWIDWF